MSLEDKIEKLTAAIEANTAALKAGGGGGISSGGSKSTTTKKEGKKITVDQVAKKFGAFLSDGGDDAKTAVKAIIKHFGAPKVTEIPEEYFEHAIQLLAAYEAGDDPLGGNDEDLM